MSGAIQQFSALVDDATRLLDADHELALDSRSKLAYWVAVGGNLARAVQLLTALVAQRTRVLGADHPDTVEDRRALERYSSQLELDIDARQ